MSLDHFDQFAVFIYGFGLGFFVWEMLNRPVLKRLMEHSDIDRAIELAMKVVTEEKSK